MKRQQPEGKNSKYADNTELFTSLNVSCRDFALLSQMKKSRKVSPSLSQVLKFVRDVLSTLVAKKKTKSKRTTNVDVKYHVF